MRWLVLAAFVQLLAADESSSKIVGRWRSLETSKGGIGAMFEYRGDGTVGFSPGAIVETSYRIEAGQLVFPAATKDGPEQRQAIVWLGDDRLRLEGMELARKGQRPDASNPIQGEWAGSREMDGRKLEIRHLFYPAGKSLLLIPFLTQQGSYSIMDGNIRIELPGRAAISGKYTVEGDVLTIPGPRGSGVSRFKRY
jgi:hypothetical protein